MEVRVAGDAVSEGGVGCGVPPPWNNFLMSILPIGFDAGVEGVADVVDDDEGAGDEEPLGGRFKVGFEVGAVVDGDLPFVLVAGTEPKDLTPSDFTVGAWAGEEDMGAPASSIDPKDTAEPMSDA